MTALLLDTSAPTGSAFGGMVRSFRSILPAIRAAFARRVRVAPATPGADGHPRGGDLRRDPRL